MRLEIPEVLFKLRCCHKFCTPAAMGKIPDRWEEYAAMGTPIKDTRFIPFKVPLNENLSCRLADKALWFTPRQLFDDIKAKGLQLGLIIDLTNTTRYYQPDVIEGEGVKYKKICTEGHSVPSAVVRQNFFDSVDEFLKINNGNDLLIGVHCTHGLNRTGYLVCRYLIDKMNFKPDDAINAFNEARGYSIERENYLVDLRKDPSSRRSCDSSPSKRSSVSHDDHSAKQSRSGVDLRQKLCDQHRQNSCSSKHGAPNPGTSLRNDQSRRDYSTWQQPLTNDWSVDCGPPRGYDGYYEPYRGYQEPHRGYQEPHHEPHRGFHGQPTGYHSHANGYNQEPHGNRERRQNGAGADSSNWRSSGAPPTYNDTPWHRDDFNPCDPWSQYPHGQQPVAEYGQFGRQYPTPTSSHPSRPARHPSQHAPSHKKTHRK